MLHESLRAPGKRGPGIACAPAGECQKWNPDCGVKKYLAISFAAPHAPLPHQTGHAPALAPPCALQ
eukprot:8551246-Pyramimonas_sp.AAC.1